MQTAKISAKFLKLNSICFVYLCANTLRF